jgi:anti-sigma B factor antagonist
MPGYRAGVNRNAVIIDVQSIAGDGTVGIGLAGELDLATADQLRDALERAAEGGDTVRVDARRVTLLDSTSLGVLLFFARRLRDRGGWLELLYATPSVTRTLEVAAIGRAIRLVDCSDEPQRPAANG